MKHLSFGSLRCYRATQHLFFFFFFFADLSLSFESLGPKTQVREGGIVEEEERVLIKDCL